MAAQKQSKKYGMQLVDLETHLECGVRKYVGVFKQGTTQQAMLTDMTWQNFTNLFGGFHAWNWHLIDFETYKDGSQRRWAGVWEVGSKGEWIHLLPRAEFEKLREKLALENPKKPKQLVDFESYRDPERRMGSRPFQSGV